jgi:hypothetical protein
VIAELLRHPRGASSAAELAHGSGDGLTDLPAGGLVRPLQRGHEQCLGPNRVDAEVVHCRPPHRADTCTPPQGYDNFWRFLHAELTETAL